MPPILMIAIIPCGGMKSSGLRFRRRVKSYKVHQIEAVPEEEDTGVLAGEDSEELAGSL